VDDQLREHLRDDGQWCSHGLQACDEALFRAAQVRDTDGIRKAAALYYSWALHLAAFMDQFSGAEVPPWSAPGVPAEGYPLPLRWPAPVS
jgi:hypothetical protein